MIKEIIKKIMAGEQVRIRVDCVDEDKINSFNGWLQNFQAKSYLGASFFNPNLYTPRQGNRYLDLRINFIPEGQRKELIGFFNTLNDSPLVFTKIESQ